MEKPTDHRVESFRQHLIHFMDDDGLIIDQVNADGPRAFRNEDFEGYSTWDLYADDFAGFISYEDSIMVTGRFIHLEVLRHLYSGRKTSLDLAHKAVLALLELSEHGDRIEPGYLPKPHSGMSKAGESQGISIDQYEHALFGLWAFRQFSDDRKMNDLIDKAILSWADYFIKHDYSYSYFGRMWSTPETSPHLIALYMPLAAIATTITGSEKYINHAMDRLWNILEENFIENIESRPDIVPNIANLLVLGLSYLVRHDIRQPECSQAVENIINKSLEQLSPEGWAYAFMGVTDKHQVTPGYRTGPAPLNYKLLNWTSNAKGGKSTKIAQSLVIAAHLLDRRDWLEKARWIENKYLRINDFTPYQDPDHTQMPEDYAYLRKTIYNQFIATWLQTWHLLQNTDLIYLSEGLSVPE
jgi:hypothetical protein